MRHHPDGIVGTPSPAIYPRPPKGEEALQAVVGHVGRYDGIGPAFLPKFLHLLGDGSQGFIPGYPDVFPFPPLSARGSFQRIEKPEGRKELGKKLGISDDQISDWLRWSQLIRLKGLGIENYLLLEKLGIDDVQTLARQEPFKLYEELVRLNKHHHITSQPLDVTKVKVWIRAARKTVGRL